MKWIEKILSILMLSLFLLILSACDNKRSNDVEEIKFGITLYNGNDTFINNISTNILEQVKVKEEEKGVKITLDIADASGSVINQGNQIDKFISREYDVICVNLVDRTLASTIIDKAKVADIPIVFFNREPVDEDMKRWHKVYYVGAQAEQSARLQGEIVSTTYEKSKEAVDKNGDGKLQYVMLEGELGHQDAVIRTEYSVKAVQENGIEMDSLAYESANWQADQGNEKMTKWIEEFGDSIEVVFSNNDEMALGAIYALNTTKIPRERWPIIVGVDGIEGALEAVKLGTMTGTVLSDSNIQAMNIVNIAYALAVEENPEEVAPIKDGKYVLIPHKDITKENVNEFLIKREKKEIK